MGAGTSSDLRALNRAVVLGALVRAGELSRTELGERCSLSSATVAKVVSDLLAGGLVEERGSVPSRGGRPIGRLGVRADGGYLLGARIADDDVAVVLLDLALERVDDETVAVGAVDPSPVQVSAALRRALRAVRSRSAAASERLLGLGLSLPGSLGVPPGGTQAPGASWAGGAAAGPTAGVSLATAETLVHAPGLGWPPVRLADLVGDLAGVPTDGPGRRHPGGPAGGPGRRGGLAVVPAGRAAALAAAEIWRGALDGPGRALVVALGRDVGLAVVSDARVDPGPIGTGEWGHTAVVPNGRRCRCGRRGCLEAYVGADAVVEAWRTRGGEPPASGPDGLTALITAADAGEGAAVTTLDMTLDLLASALGTAVTLTGADEVVVGGWAGELLVRARGAALATRAREATAAPWADLLALTACRVPDAGAFGAALCVLGTVARAAGAGGAAVTQSLASPVGSWR